MASITSILRRWLWLAAFVTPIYQSLTWSLMAEPHFSWDATALHNGIYLSGPMTGKCGIGLRRPFISIGILA